jgi:hypothetical protein
MNLRWLSPARALLPGALRAPEDDCAPAPFLASEPGGASDPLIWLVILLVLILASLWIAAGFFGLPAAQWFCDHALNSAAAVLGVVVGPLLAYRSFNKRTAAKVAIAQAGQAQAPASVTVATEVKA